MEQNNKKADENNRKDTELALANKSFNPQNKTEMKNKEIVVKDIVNDEVEEEQEEEEEACSCFCWKFVWNDSTSYKPKVRRKNTINLPSKIMRRRSKKRPESGNEVIIEEQNNLKPITIAILSGGR